MQPARYATSCETVYGSIKRMLISCEISPGAAIHIADLADRLRVSPTPVREALNRLLVERLVIRNKERGFCSRSFDPVEQRDLVLVRAMLVGGAVRRLIGATGDVRSSDDRAAEHAHSARPLEDGSTTLRFLHDVQLSIVRRTGSPELASALQGLIDRALPSGGGREHAAEREWARTACATLLLDLEDMRLERAEHGVDEIARCELAMLAAGPTSNETALGEWFAGEANRSDAGRSMHVHPPLARPARAAIVADNRHDVFGI